MNENGLTDEQEKYLKRKIQKMDCFLILFTMFLLTFTVVMILIYFIKGGIPDTLCTCVFAVIGVEYGACAWIKTNKQKYESMYESELFKKDCESDEVEIDDDPRNVD